MPLADRIDTVRQPLLAITKRCPRCKQTQAISHFGRNRWRRDGLALHCRDCQKLFNSETYPRMRQRPEFRRLCVQRAVEWQKSNPDKANARARRWYHKNKGKANLATRRWQNNPERVRRVGRAWAHRPDSLNKRRIQNQKRRARLFGSDATFSIQDWQATLERQLGKCGICGLSVALTIDHIIPLSKGGKHEPANVQALCRPCNSRKGNKLACA